MARRRSKKRLSLGMLIILVIIAAIFFKDEIKLAWGSNIEEPLPVSDDLNIYFLDVGQADAIYIRNSTHNMLIDAGNNEDGEKLVKYLSSLGIEKFEYLVGTHAHEDHIGGMDDIINAFEVEHFLMPDAITTTKTFEDVLDALDNKGYSFETPELGSEFTLGDCKFEVLNISSDSKELNNTSIVLRMRYGEKSFLFMGDAEEKVEKDLLSKNIRADVLKVGHHGSEFSSSVKFLDAVRPEYAVISVGKNNTYNHPKDIVLKRLEERNIKIYRTDQNGTIHLNSDGKTMNFEFIKTDTNG